MRRAAALLAVGVAATWAAGQQRTPNAEAARPTNVLHERNRVGGYYTGTYNSPLSRIGLPSQVSSVPGGYSGPRFLGASQESQALMNMPRLGSMSIRERRFMMGPQANTPSLQYSSGMIYATSLDNPPMAYIYSQPPVTSLYALPPDEDPFRAFFGLRDAQAADQTRSLDQRTFLERGNQAQATLTTAMRQNTEDAVQGLRTQSLDAFKSGDYESALWMFSSLRRIDKRSHLPSLLAVHAALNKGRIALATEHLLQAVDRDPSLFVDAVDVKEYFGDQAEYEKQIRENSRMPDDADAGDLLIKVYCAWRMGDKVTARAALDRAREAARDKPLEQAVIIFSRAMKPALD
jgi:hypothetical protein